MIRQCLREGRAPLTLVPFPSPRIAASMSTTWPILLFSLHFGGAVHEHSTCDLCRLRFTMVQPDGSSSPLDPSSSWMRTHMSGSNAHLTTAYQPNSEEIAVCVQATPATPINVPASSATIIPTLASIHLGQNTR